MTGRLFVFAGGGTGGHLAPGLAVAAELRRREPDCRIRFVGSGRPIEQQMLGDSGYEIDSHDVQPLSQLKRRPLRMMRSHWKAYRAERAAMRQDTPAAVVGLGGYASVPVVLAARREKAPVLLLEQNAIAGRATRLLARWIPVCVTFEESSRTLPRGAVVHVTGNPLRAEIANHDQDRPGVVEKKTLLVLGGSQGSSQVNSAVVHAVSELKSGVLSGWRIVHQTGPEDSAEVATAYSDMPIDHTVEPFFPDLSRHYSEAGLCVSRAGATTLTELAAAGLPAILIPYPFAADDHQAANAQAFEDAGAAVVLDARDHWGDLSMLGAVITEVLKIDGQQEKLRQAMLSLAKPDAAGRVVDLLLGSD